MTGAEALQLPEERYFDPEPSQRRAAMEIYAEVKSLPLICPHGHVDPRVFADPDYRFGSPADLLIIPDHYVFRMLYSQGVPLEKLGIPARDGRPVELDHRKIWQTFADYYYLFRGTPTGMWLKDELYNVFGIRQKLTPATAQAIYDEIEHKLTLPEFRPRRLYERFHIEVLCTTDPATSDLRHHKAIRESGWTGRIVPTFRPDAVVNLDTPNWRDHIDALAKVSGIDIGSYHTFIRALETQRERFKQMGATATDHAAASATTEELTESEAETIFARALRGEASSEDARRFTAHMLIEMARMSVEDGLVMQLHPGSFRNHNQMIYEVFGTDMGADIPTAGEFTRALRPLLHKFGNERNFTLILFTLDETTFSRELAPLAGHYPAVRIGPPWWFYDSWNGMMRFREAVSETAGLYNTVGFNDDTRAYPSIPARHDLARRVDANWLANLVVRHIIDMDEAVEMAHAAAYGLAKEAYRQGD
jgi:glucuronate isomerase